MTVQTINSIVSNNVRIICPRCKSSKELSFPRTIINNSSQLTTVSIPKGLVCIHTFQAFIDKNFKVRGYQNVDFEFADTIKEPCSVKNVNKFETKSDDDLINNLVVEGNYLEYRSKTNRKEEYEKSNVFRIPQKDNNRTQDKNVADNRRKMMMLEDIYKEFWELIDDNNEEFKEFIIKDKERRKNLKISDLSYFDF